MIYVWKIFERPFLLFFDVCTGSVFLQYSFGKSEAEKFKRKHSHTYTRTHTNKQINTHTGYRVTSVAYCCKQFAIRSRKRLLSFSQEYFSQSCDSIQQKRSFNGKCLFLFYWITRHNVLLRHSRLAWLVNALNVSSESPWVA